MSTNTILVVDDDKITLRILSTLLELDGLDVVTTTDPFEALLLASKTDFAFALLDIMMPGMDGFELCEKIREYYPNKNALPIYFVTAYQAADLEFKAREVGATGIIEKPIKSEEIISLVREFAFC